MYYSDLQEVQWYYSNLIKVGWLDEEHPYPKGDVPKEFMDKLKKIPLKLATKGFHRCPFCGNHKSSCQYMIEIDRKSRKYYDVPEMIIHYIEEHNYLPPQEFIDFIMNAKIIR